MLESFNLPRTQEPDMTDETPFNVTRVENLLQHGAPWVEWSEEDRATFIASLHPEDGDPKAKDEAEALTRKLFGRNVTYFAAVAQVDRPSSSRLRRHLLNTVPFGAGMRLLDEIEGFDLIRSLRPLMQPA
jgi:hypothetical protein